jgi:hypothetical protein
MKMKKRKKMKKNKKSILCCNEFERVFFSTSTFSASHLAVKMTLGLRIDDLQSWGVERFFLLSERCFIEKLIKAFFSHAGRRTAVRLIVKVCPRWYV